jgi:hypothetical protein
MFCCSPASAVQANDRSFGDGPFLSDGCLALPEHTDEHRTSIKSDSIWANLIICLLECQPEMGKCRFFQRFRQNQRKLLFRFVYSAEGGTTFHHIIRERD